MNRIGGWVAALGVLGATAALVAMTPTDMLTSFEVRGGVGESIHSRLADVEVLGVRLAERVEGDDDEIDGTTNGVWVVVDVLVTPTLQRLSLESSLIRIGGTTYGTSDLLGLDDMRTQPYGAGVTQQGSLLFEVPESALADAGARSATIVVETTSDTRLDSVPVVVVDLAALEVQRSVQVDPRFVPERP